VDHFPGKNKTTDRGREIGIYTGYYYWRDHAHPIRRPGQESGIFSSIPLWIAHYQTPKPIPKPWFADEWTFWQFTETAAALNMVSRAMRSILITSTEIRSFPARFLRANESSSDPLPQAGPGTIHQVIPSILRVRKDRYPIRSSADLNAMNLSRR
jgi:hypothetical protein